MEINWRAEFRAAAPMGITDTELAKRLGVHQATVSYNRKAHRFPREKYGPIHRDRATWCVRRGYYNRTYGVLADIAMLLQDTRAEAQRKVTR